ncbi:right-handed parallel beta-helix repeat-containing protein [Bacteroidota bacterium]
MYFWKAILISVSALLAINLQAQTIYVSPSGSDSNPGTRVHPLKEVQTALNYTEYDSVILMDGTYFIDAPIRMQKSGSAEKPLVIMAEHPLKAIIDANAYIVESKSGRSPHGSGIASFHFADVHYIEIRGIEMRNSHGMGFGLAHGSSHLLLYGCRSVNSFNSGIGLWYSDKVKVLHCEVIGANQIPMKTEEDRVGREAPHEALTIAGATHFEVAYNHVHHCEKEGIDCKEVSSHGTIHHNYTHDLPRQGLYVDCWFGLLQDVEFSYNIAHDCEWGMAISAEGKDASMKNIRIHHNILYDNRGSGIFFGVWGNDEARDSIFIYNNTVYNCGSPNHWAGPTGGIDVCSQNITNTFIYNNIFHNNYAYEIGISLEGDERSTWEKERNVVITHNHSGVFKSISTPPGSYGSIYGYRGHEASEGDPELSEAPGFMPSASSPARRSGWIYGPMGYVDYIGATASFPGTDEPTN